MFKRDLFLNKLSNNKEINDINFKKEVEIAK